MLKVGFYHHYQRRNPKDALSALKALRAELQALYDQEARMQADLAVFKINVPDNQDLRRLDRELAVLEEVWDLASQWEDAWLSFKSGNFWEIKTDDMDEVATTLFRFDVNNGCKLGLFKNVLYSQSSQCAVQAIEGQELGYS